MIGNRVGNNRPFTLFKKFSEVYFWRCWFSGLLEAWSRTSFITSPPKQRPCSWEIVRRYRTVKVNNTGIIGECKNSSDFLIEWCWPGVPTENSASTQEDLVSCSTWWWRSGNSNDSSSRLPYTNTSSIRCGPPRGLWISSTGSLSRFTSSRRDCFREGSFATLSQTCFLSLKLHALKSPRALLLTSVSSSTSRESKTLILSAWLASTSTAGLRWIWTFGGKNTNPWVELLLKLSSISSISVRKSWRERRHDRPGQSCIDTSLSLSQCSSFDSLRAQEYHFRANGVTAPDYPTSSSSSDKNAHRFDLLPAKPFFSTLSWIYSQKCTGVSSSTETS